MKTTASAPNRAFTLIEMLVVLAIIGILAAFLLPAAGRIKQKGILSRAKSQLSQLQTAIDAYKQKTGYYPPDNMPQNWQGDPVNNVRFAALNPLYFELVGTRRDRPSTTWSYETLDGLVRVGENDVTNIFPNAEGFANFAANAGGDDSATSQNFLPGLKSTQIHWLTNVTASPRIPFIILIGSTPWPNDNGPLATFNFLNPERTQVNPWRYISTNPTNNVEYNLWIDLVIGGKTNRVSNWRVQPEIVGSPVP